jgi:hydroxymethylpyrimidine pyrophosphatase-like HAD family hydrolase
MWFHALACDYDGTLAMGGSIAPTTMEALQRVRESGRRVLLITGRRFDDLLEVCPQIDFFDLVVAENGAVLYEPRAKRAEDLAEPPPDAFLSGLHAAGVPYETGRVIVATVVPHEIAVLETIRRLGLELQIIFNKEAVMILPSGVSKESGLRQALRRMGISVHNAMGIGDAENDHAFLKHVGFSVAVANAVPALAAEVDLVTTGINGAGVRELIEGPLAADFEALRTRRRVPVIELGATDDGTPVTYPAFGPSLMITGTSGTGKSTLTGVFVERLVREDYVICLFDPEGDYHTLVEQEGVVVLKCESGTEENRADEVNQLLRHRSTSVAVDLSALNREERIHATARFLHALRGLRAETGAPHWIIFDEAHHVFPPGGSPAQEIADFGRTGVCLITNEPASVDPAVLRIAQHVFSTSVEAVTETMPLVPRDAIAGGPLDTGEALSITIDDGVATRIERFRVARRETSHKRHVRKYATGKLSPERWFHFRGPQGKLDLIAQNLEMFTMLAKGVDEDTWTYHLGNGEIARWLREQIKDEELADEVAALENQGDAAETRRIALEAIGRRYTPVASPDPAS